MSKALQRIEEFKQSVMLELLGQCTDEQQKFFYRLYPNGPRPEQFNNAIDQIERTIVKNNEKSSQTITSATV